MQIIFESDDEIVNYISKREDLVDSILLRTSLDIVVKILKTRYYGNSCEQYYNYTDGEFNLVLKNRIEDFEGVIKRIRSFMK